MYPISKITDKVAQTQTLILPDGTSLQLTIRFYPMQYGWFIDELNYLGFIIRGMRIVNSPNMLHQYYNQIPFGLACYSTNNREPSLQQDFLSGASVLSLLDASEVQYYLAYLKNG